MLQKSQKKQDIQESGHGNEFLYMIPKARAKKIYHK